MQSVALTTRRSRPEGDGWLLSIGAAAAAATGPEPANRRHNVAGRRTVIPDAQKSHRDETSLKDETNKIKSKSNRTIL